MSDINTMTDKTPASPAHIAAWTLAVAGAGLAILPEMPAWGRMWALAASCFFATKAFVTSGRVASLEFVLLWPGMDLPAFERRTADRTLAQRWWRYGALNILFGITLIVAARRVTDDFAAAWLGMVSLIFIMHCGVFALLAAFWRNVGRDVVPLMNNPVAAGSVTEFWSRRWNLAFRDAARHLLVKTRRIRGTPAMRTLAVFAWSGALHELLISVPAGGGYRGPMLYFLIQAMGVLLEGRCGLKQRWIWRLRAWLFLVGPLPLLFHRPFVDNVMVPFFKTLGVIA